MMRNKTRLVGLSAGLLLSLLVTEATDAWALSCAAPPEDMHYQCGNGITDCGVLVPIDEILVCGTRPVPRPLPPQPQPQPQPRPVPQNPEPIDCPGGNIIVQRIDGELVLICVMPETQKPTRPTVPWWELEDSAIYARAMDTDSAESNADTPDDWESYDVAMELENGDAGDTGALVDYADSMDASSDVTLDGDGDDTGTLVNDYADSMDASQEDEWSDVTLDVSANVDEYDQGDGILPGEWDDWNLPLEPEAQDPAGNVDCQYVACIWGNCCEDSGSI